VVQAAAENKRGAPAQEANALTPCAAPAGTHARQRTQRIGKAIVVNSGSDPDRQAARRGNNAVLECAGTTSRVVHGR